MQHKYLFFQDKGQVKTYHLREQHFELIRYKGNEGSLVGDTEFWDWWGKTASFISAKDKVDFCFLSDALEWESQGGFETVEESSWTRQEVKQFLLTYLSFSEITLNQNELSERFTFNIEKMGKMLNTSISLYIQAAPSKILVDPTRVEEITTRVVAIEDEPDLLETTTESTLSTYYREKTKSYQ